MNTFRFTAALVLASLATGCSKEKMNELVDQAKETATSVASDVSAEVKAAAETTAAKVESVAETAGDVSGIGDTTGRATMTLDTPTEFAASYIQVLTINPGRPSVLKISSGKDGDLSTFPAFLIQANLTVDNLQALAGQTIPARLFAQKESSGPIWYSADDAPIPVSIAISDGKVTARIDETAVLSTANETPAQVSGSFECVLHPVIQNE